MSTDVTELQTRDAWLAERRTGLGGSDAAAACGLSKWKSRYRLWLEKCGFVEDAGETQPMHWGTMLEPIVRQEYCNRTRRTVITPSQIIRHPRVAFMLANPDGLVVDEQRGYEGKTARSDTGWGEPGSDEIPEDYGLQVQHYMAVTGLPVFDVAVLIGGSDFRIYEVEADRELQELLIEREAEFWRMVETQTEPEATSAEDTKLRWPRSTMRTVTATTEDEELAVALARVKGLIKNLELSADELTAKLQQHMADAEGLALPDGKLLATWKSAKGSTRFDVDTFKQDYPDLWKAYLRTGEGSRRFLLKESKA